MLTTRWNGYVATLNDKPWGGLYMPSNNYYWGYLRNSLLWGMATQHENAQASGFIDHALNVRYRNFANPIPSGTNVFANWSEAFGVGGVTLEGSQYGPYILAYSVIAFTSATDYGYDAWQAVPYWRDAAYSLQYATTPAPTSARDGATPRYEVFPFNDDEFFREGGNAERGAYADFLGAITLRYPNTAVGRQARDWLSRVPAAPSWWIAAELEQTPISGQAPVLPLDYFAEGAQFLYGRRSAQPNATAFLFQLGGVDSYAEGDANRLAAGGVGHSHLDAGSFQLWRNGRWLSRETTGYSSPDNVVAWNNGAPVDPREAVAHNAVLFEGQGQIGNFRGLADVLRLESVTDYAYAAVDLTDAYRAAVVNSWDARYDWPYAEVALRELLYLREMDALVVLDRLQSGDDSLHFWYDDPRFDGPRLNAAQVRKSFVLHAGGNSGSGTNPFTLGHGTATARVGDQRLDLATLLPANPAYRVISEGGEVGQYRLEYDVSGNAETYLLNVISLRDANDAAVTATLSSGGGEWTVSLTRPGSDAAVVTFRQGIASTGGTVRIGSREPRVLHSSIQGFVVGDNGPHWLETPMTAQ